VVREEMGLEHQFTSENYHKAFPKHLIGAHTRELKTRKQISSDLCEALYLLDTIMMVSVFGIAVVE